MSKLINLICLAFLVSFPALAKTPVETGPICVEYGQCPLDVSAFTCTEVISSFIGRVCYDEPRRFMVIELKTTWYPYCEIDAATVQKLLTAESAIRSHGDQQGPFDCRDHPMPNYPAP
jgi:hypothetical protein